MITLLESVIIEIEEKKVFIHRVIELLPKYFHVCFLPDLYLTQTVTGLSSVQDRLDYI